MDLFHDDKTKSTRVGVDVNADTSNTEISTGSSVPIRTRNIFTRLKTRVQLEPQHGSFAPGRWSNAGESGSDSRGRANMEQPELYLLLAQRCNCPWNPAAWVLPLHHGTLLENVHRSSAPGFHIPFTIQSRASFGMFFSFVIVSIRMVVAAFWYGINTYTGAQCVNVISLAIWPQFAQVPNRLPASANITTQMMTSYIVYFLFSIVCLPAIFGMLIWACVATGGAGTENPVFRRGNTISGNELGWAFMSGLNAMMGNYGTLAVNINDFTRYARVAGGLTCSFSSSQCRSCCSRRERAVLAAGSMAIAQVGTNLGANCVSAANDLNAMFPRYINLRRGSYIIALVGAWALTPWNILASADALLNFMDGYAILAGPNHGYPARRFLHRPSAAVRRC
ncbi:cytosine-purine permease [Apiospora hydei]|uniref:Cytosine-purine permease n=1 Tax=Apiospora hydei TaxID=1337664 RepID=A0ABR1V5L0_9PEZI